MKVSLGIVSERPAAVESREKTARSSSLGGFLPLVSNPFHIVHTRRRWLSLLIQLIFDKKYRDVDMLLRSLGVRRLHHAILLLRFKLSHLAGPIPASVVDQHFASLSGFFFLFFPLSFPLFFYKYIPNTSSQISPLPASLLGIPTTHIALLLLQCDLKFLLHIFEKTYQI